MENLKSSSGILDLGIIGGGPAGTAAALEARHHGLSVAVWERDHFPRDKVCGEFVSSEAIPFLQTEIPAAVATGTAIRCAEFVTDQRVSRTFRLPRPALGVSRRRLDIALWRAAEAAGAEAYEGECVQAVRRQSSGDGRAGHWEVKSDRGSIRTAKALVVACGRWWGIEGLSSPARYGDQPSGEWVGLKAHFAGVPARSKVEMYFFAGGYCGIAPVEDGACNVCCLVHREKFREYGSTGLDDFAGWLGEISRLTTLQARLQGGRQLSPVVTTAPVHLARRQATQRGALMVGDASGFIDPFTGEGISMALHSGGLAARTVAAMLLEGFSAEHAGEIYGQGLARAVQRSYRIAAITRCMVHGPEWLRRLIATPLPWIGRHLVLRTRWRETRK